jgi:bifunctional DNase/RNase
MINMVLESVKVLSESDMYQISIVSLCELQGKRYLHISVDPDEAQIITSALQNKASGSLRDLYDLLCLIITGFSAKVVSANISAYTLPNDKTYYNAKILITHGVKEFETVCYAPEAIAIAIFTQAPIFVDESVLNVADKDRIMKESVAGLSWLDGKEYYSHNLDESSSTIKLNNIVSDDLNAIFANVEMVVDSITSDPLGIINNIVLSDKVNNWRLSFMLQSFTAKAIYDIIYNNKLPHTYNLLYKILDGLSTKIIASIISDCLDSVIKAQLILEYENGHFLIECRPSDAIILSLIAKKPIYAKESVLKSMGISQYEKNIIAQKEAQIESLVNLIKTPTWKLWGNNSKKIEAQKILIDISENASHIDIRKRAHDALEKLAIR